MIANSISEKPAEGRYRVCAVLPRVRPGAFSANADSLVRCFEAAAAGGAELVAFNTLNIAGACGCLEEFPKFNELGHQVINEHLCPALDRLGLDSLTMDLAQGDECLVGEFATLRRRFVNLSKTRGTLVYAGFGAGAAPRGALYPGVAFIAEEGKLLAESKPWLRDEQLLFADVSYEPAKLSARKFLERRAIDRSIFADVRHPFIPSEQTAEYLDELLAMQRFALATRLDNIGCRQVVIGVSGGLDSALALVAAAGAFDLLGLDRAGIRAVSMPGFGTTGRTQNNSEALSRGLGTTFREISIAAACRQHFQDIGHDETVQNAVYENAQARERTQILMDLANGCGGIVIGTGDMSEAALGWCTYNGDHMSMYGVNANLPKTLIRALTARFAESCESAQVAETLRDILDTPISPELLPPDEKGEIAQHTEATLGPYEVHDFFLWHFLAEQMAPRELLGAAVSAFDGVYSEAELKLWCNTFIRRFFSQQFKRNCQPDAPELIDVSLSPLHWAMPGDISCADWLLPVD